MNARLASLSLVSLVAALVALAAAALTAGCAPTFDAALPDLAPVVVKATRPDLAAPPDLAPAGDLAEPAPDLLCGGMAFALERIPPNVMLVLDRSGSMGDPIASGSTTSKWSDLKAALTSLVNGYDAQMRFGVDLFSSDNDCGAGQISVQPAAMTGAQVLAQVNAISPGGNTPTAVTLDVILKSPSIMDATRGNAVVLATDGLPNCGDTDVASRIAALYALTPSVKTYVIGVGSDTASNPTLLDAWAVAGHTDLPGTTKYYQTNSPAQLKAAFDAIAGGLVSCSFKLSQPAPDPSLVNVFVSGAPIAADATNGFTYDDAGPSVTLHGSSCAALQAAPATKIDVTYGCPQPPPVS